jgi:peptide/nickel transport system substrate-binding protein
LLSARAKIACITIIATHSFAHREVASISRYVEALMAVRAPGSPHRRDLLRFFAAMGFAAPTARLLATNAAIAAPPAGTAIPALTVFVPNWPDHVEIWRQLTQAWAPLGIELDLHQGTLDTWVAQVVGQHQTPHLTSMSWGGAPDRLDPDYFLSEFFLGRRDINGGLNYGHYHSDTFDKLGEAQRAEMDQSKRQTLVRDAQAQIATDIPSLFLFHRDIIHAYNKQNFTGMTPIFGNGIGAPYMPMAFMNIEGLTPRKVIKISTLYDVASLNPFFTPEVYNSGIMRLMYGTLVTRDAKTDLMPWALESWNIVDATTVDVVLRPGTKFHDGHPATVEDLKFTFDFIAKWKFPNMSRVTDSVASTEITGDHTLRLKLKAPYAPFVANVLGYTFIAPKHIWENIPANLASPMDWPNDTPVGTGPWKFVTWRKGEFLQFATNQDFFMKPKLDGMVMLPVPQLENMIGMLDRGDIDMIAWSLDQPTAQRIEKNPALVSARVGGHGMHEIRLNLAMAPCNNPAFRLALQHVTDRQKLLDVIFAGAGVPSKGGPLTPALTAWANPDLKLPEPSPDKARAVLKDAGFGWDGNGHLLMPSA